MKRALVIAVALLAVSVPTWAKPKTRCSVYFSVVEFAPSLPNGQARRLNHPQKRWFERHGDRDKLAGICYDPAKADYLIRWTGEQVRLTRGSLVARMLPPQSDTSASGRLFRIGKDETLTPIETFNENTDSGQAPQDSASVALLKHGLEAIVRAERARKKSH